jgi:hypothetical protein
MAGECDSPADAPAGGPDPSPGRPPVAIRARYRGIDGPDRVGGDFYARCEAAERTRVILGDVRGKGAPAAGKARLLTDAFLAAAGSCAGLEEVSRALDRVACSDAAAEADPAAGEWFATAVLLEIDGEGRNVTVINHGHPAPVLVAPDAVRELAPARARLPLGLGRLVPAPAAAAAAAPDTHELPPDATLILFTDGLSEARDHTGRMFDPVAWLAGTADLGVPARLLDRLYLEAERHNGGSWRDDLALVSVRRRTGAGAGGAARRTLPPQLPSGADAPRAAPRASVPRPPSPEREGRPPIPSPSAAPKPPARPKAPIAVSPTAARVPPPTSRRPLAPHRPRAPRNPPRPPLGGPPPPPSEPPLPPS